ncbi:tetratricopeptide repeat protein [Nakamurella sp.]|uniref:tetratricopeptide repeat protein n=1 Tax=Nakamurella sp. TaxID=1869182 RepID=UPI003784ADFC
MTSQLVATKLYVPRLRRNSVARPRLSARLDRGSETRLTLISAPAGFGKTTLLTAWLAGVDRENRSVAWLSLDQNDSRPGPFWTYLITALQTAVPGVGAGVLPLLQSTPPPIQTVLAAVLNELSAVPVDVDLVLDDYHLVDGPDIGAGMTFLLDHLPPQIHLVISSRADPALPLARLRARGELVEVRAADLRFTPDEAATYLNDVTGLDLAPADIAALEGRTEGWIAALQLAALSMQGRKDVGDFIAGFAGDDRYIVDYLVEEVLQRQTAQVRTFLLRTSLLDRLSGPLCDAVTGEPGGKATLEALDRANLFLIPLDDNRHWYRYHHLFADMLRAHLLDERPDEVDELHRRASRWYDRDGQPAPAVRHALAAGDVERAADLVELAGPELRRTRQEATIRAWLDVIPDEVVRARPVLAIGLIGALMAGNEFDGVEERLSDVERRLAASDHDDPGGSAGDMIVVDEKELSRLPGVIAMSRAGLAMVRGDLPGTIRHARLAMGRAPADDHVTRAGAAALSGLAFWAGGDLEAAARAYADAVDGLQRAGHIADVLGCSIAIADIRITQGRLTDALRTYEHALQLASDEPGPVLRGTADMYVGLSQIACERGDLAAATEHLRRSQELGEHIGLPQNPYRRRVAMARIRQSQGDLAGALTLLDEAQRVYVGDFSPNVRPVEALRARVLAAQGNVPKAMEWAREQGLQVDDKLSYVREFEHITLARILLAQGATSGDRGSLGPVTRLLDNLLSAADAGGRTGSAIEILVLQALTRHADGDTAGALTALDRALTLAEPEGYVQVFVGEGAPMASLLTVVAARRTASDHVRRLLDAFTRDGATAPAPSPVERMDRRGPGLVESLSDRELDVLRLLATDLDGPAIARRLFVSVNTMRTHTKSIYAKLGVNSRRAAVRRAEELDLLAHTPQQ